MSRQLTSLKTLKRPLPAASASDKLSPLSLTQFALAVYSYSIAIPSGTVTTYSALAAAIGSPGAGRAVGTALRKNPFAPQVPCHRIVAADYSLGGFQGSKDLDGENMKKKISMLKTEGVLFDSEYKINSKSICNWSKIGKIRVLNQHELLSRVREIELADESNKKLKK